MKPLNTLEIDALISGCGGLINAEAQDFCGDQNCMVLKLWSDGLKALVFQIKGGTPLFLGFDSTRGLAPCLLKKPPQKPFFLFYKTHFKGQKLLSINRIRDFGRLVEFVFEGDKKIEFRLFPGGVNLALKSDGKVVYLFKPLELSALDEDYQPESVRSPTVVKEEWLDGQKKNSRVVSEGLEAKNKKKLEAKKDKAERKIKEALEFLKTEPHQRFAELLQSKNELPSELKDLYREKLTLRENIEWGFAQQKENGLKIKRLEERLEQLDELPSKAKTSSGSQKVKAELKSTRHMTLSKDVRVFCGKTAAENLDLLRKSKSWHIWMHLKDYPSGHLILACPKNHLVTEEELRKSALFLFKVAAPKKLHAAQKVSFEIIFTETKFVKPIKGAKKGLVQPSRTKSRLFVWNKSENLSF